MGWDGTDVRRLSREIPGGWWAFVASSWSPDGKHIATQALAGTAYQTWEVATDGSSETPVGQTGIDQVGARDAPGDGALLRQTPSGATLMLPASLAGTKRAPACSGD